MMKRRKRLILRRRAPLKKIELERNSAEEWSDARGTFKYLVKIDHFPDQPHTFLMRRGRESHLFYREKLLNLPSQQTAQPKLLGSAPRNTEELVSYWVGLLLTTSSQSEAGIRIFSKFSRSTVLSETIEPTFLLWWPLWSSRKSFSVIQWGVLLQWCWKGGISLFLSLKPGERERREMEGVLLNTDQWLSP